MPQTITPPSDFEAFVTDLLPLASSKDLDWLLQAYFIPLVIKGPLFGISDDNDPTALNQSSLAIGQQQRANTLYAEATFICPSYWLANAYSRSSLGGDNDGPAERGWKYQFSVPPAEHDADLDAYKAFNREALGEVARGRFMVHDDPTLPDSIVNLLTTSADGVVTGNDI